MSSPSTLFRTTAIVALGLGMAGAVARAAAATRFWEQRAALQRELRAEQQRLGLAGRENQKALYAQFPTPEITLCKPVVIAPGASAPVTLGGKFVEKTTFLVANDAVTLDGTMAAGKFSGNVTAAADASPSWAPIHAIAPVSGANDSCPAVFVGSVVAYDFKADNGWIIKMTPQAKAFAIADRQASLPYQVTFFKDGEAKPFRTMAGELTLRDNESPDRDLYISLQKSGGPGSPEAELAEIQRKLSQPDAYKKLGMKELERLSTRMAQLTEVQLKEMTAPDYAEKAAKEQDEFGCSSLGFTVKAGAVTGRVSCGRNVGSNGYLKLTGTPMPAA